MGLSVSDSGGSFELPPAGVHVARCYRLIDLGTQTSNWQGKETRQPKISLAWELLGDERTSDGRPFSITRRLTASLGEKATLRALLKSWRGRDFTAEELKRFDLKTVVGVYGLANVVHETRDGNTYANLASLMPLPKGMPKPEAVNGIQVFDLSNPDNNVWEQLSQKMQETILESPEGKAWFNGHPAAPDPTTEPVGAGVDFDDEIPF
ncbi:hypothetical protein JCM19379_22870 [Methyloparacoccus murrellii]